MRKLLINIAAGIAVTFIIFVIGLFCWKTQRWINWKFSYGNKVEVKIEQLEKRIEVLEAK